MRLHLVSMCVILCTFAHKLHLGVPFCRPPTVAPPPSPRHKRPSSAAPGRPGTPGALGAWAGAPEEETDAPGARNDALGAGTGVLKTEADVLDIGVGVLGAGAGVRVRLVEGAGRGVGVEGLRVEEDVPEAEECDRAVLGDGHPYSKGVRSI